MPYTSIKTQPANASVAVNNMATFTVEMNYTEGYEYRITYEWYFKLAGTQNWLSANKTETKNTLYISPKSNVFTSSFSLRSQENKDNRQYKAKITVRIRSLGSTIDLPGVPFEIYETVPATLTAASTEHLFDLSSFDTVDVFYRVPLIQAANRWNNFIQYFAGNRRLYQSLPHSVFGWPTAWNGLRLQPETLKIEDETGSSIARCGPFNFWSLINDVALSIEQMQNTVPTLQKNSLSFTLFINSSFSKPTPVTGTDGITRIRQPLTNDDWVNVLTHELGHALGIGIYWSSANPSLYSTAPLPLNSFLDGTTFPRTRTGYQMTTGQNRTLIPIESEGGVGSVGSHWEDDYRPAAIPSVIDYLGLSNELLTASYMTQTQRALLNVRDPVISRTTLKFLRDIGYQEKLAGNSEGNPRLVRANETWPPLSPLSIQSDMSVMPGIIKFKCC